MSEVTAKTNMSSVRQRKQSTRILNISQGAWISNKNKGKQDSSELFTYTIVL